MIPHINIVALLVMAFVIVALVGVPVFLIVFGVRASKRDPFGGRIMLALGPVLLAVVLVPLARHVYRGGPWHTRIVTRGFSPSGQEYCVVQAFQNLAEPYEISFYIRDTCGVWRWYYLDHQGYAWRNASVEFEDQEALILRHGKPYRVIQMPTGTVEIASVPGGHRNQYCPAGFSVEDVFRFHRQR